MNTTILNHLINHANDYALKYNIQLSDFGITSSMIYSIVEGCKRKTIGVTLTPHNEGKIDVLQGKTIQEVFDYAKHYDPVQRAFALSLVNALGQHAIHNSIELQEDIRSLLSKNILAMTNKDDEVIFIGNLKPVVMRLHKEQRVPLVFCRNKEHYEKGVYSDIFEYEHIQKNNIAIITGASLIGSTLDALIKLSPKNSIRILAGFSAGAHPSWFKGTGITHIASIAITTKFKASLHKDQWDSVFSYPSYFIKVE